MDHIEKISKPSFLRRVINRIQVVLLGHALLFSYEKVLTKRRKDYFREALRDIDMAVVVGGGIIKFRVQYFYHRLKALFEGCDSYHIPAVLNAVGVEGFDIMNKKCLTLK